MFAIHRVKHILPTSALKSLYYALIHSHLNYAIQIWGNSNHIYKLTTLQKRALRAISKKPYLSHTEPLFKQNRILKIGDLYSLQISLFMYDLHNNKLPTSFNKLRRQRTHPRATRLATTLQMPTYRAQTDYSAKLPRHFFIKSWNRIENNIKLSKSKTSAKKQITTDFINLYKDNIICNNAHCKYCN